MIIRGALLLEFTAQIDRRDICRMIRYPFAHRNDIRKHSARLRAAFALFQALNMVFLYLFLITVNFVFYFNDALRALRVVLLERLHQAFKGLVDLISHELDFYGPLLGHFDLFIQPDCRNIRNVLRDI